MHVFASSGRVDTDFTAKLTDVYPDGRSILICDGIRRARYRNGVETAELMAPGQVYEIPIDLGSTAIVFDAGHTVRVAVSSSNAPRFSPNPNTGGDLSVDDDAGAVAATNTIYMEEEYPSRVVLPVRGEGT